ncbi:uncharacterized protein LOC133195878 [Saccostrea echinata]|uniref:uncharacterized protein LOC133195878 n=1 Tax=Saccostrea echinata TaxID=191078 RepID=UPI002A8146C5|nr:uncharacterized protein LOC133195878 [Saccostrea echinata]
MRWWTCITYILFCLPLKCMASTRCYYSDGQPEGYCHEQTFSETGQVRFAATIGIHEPLDDHLCGDISPSGVQTAIAVKWIVDILNGAGDFVNAFVPGIKLGYDIYDDCGIVSRATDGVSEKVSNTDPSILMKCDDQCPSAQPPFLGLLSSSTPEATSAALSVLSPAITGVTSQSPYKEINDRRLMFTLHEEEEIKGIVKLMQHQKWSMIAVLYVDNQSGVAMYEALVNQSQNSGICLAYTANVKEKDLSISTDKAQLEPIIEELEKRQKKLIDEKLSVVFLGNTKTAKILFEYISDRPTNVIIHKLQWIFPSNIHLDYNLKNILKKPLTQQEQSQPKVIFVEKQHRSLTSFKNFFVDELLNSNKYDQLPKPYLDQYESKMLGPSSGNKNDLIEVFRQTGSVLPTVTAIMMFATSLRKMQKELCSIQSNLQFCPELRSNLTNESLRLDPSSFEHEIQSSNVIPDELKNLTITNDSFLYSFQSLQDLQFSLFDSSDATLRKLASLKIEEIVVHDESKLLELTSECKLTCEECWNTEDIDFAYIPGDVLLLGIFSLREDGSTSSTDSINKYKCGAFRDAYTPITVSSFLHSITSLQEQNLARTTVGGIALDDCYNPLSISYVLSELFTGRRHLKDPETGERIDFSKVIAVIGALSSKVTQIIADQLTLLDIPLISYGASSATLDDRIRYPLFLRTVPSDHFQVQGLVDLLEKLKYSHVGVIYLDDAYGQNAKQSFITMTEHKKICIEEPLPITEDFKSDEIQSIIDKLTAQRVKVVLYIGIDTVSEMLLDKLKSNIADIHFTFVASEGWGTNTRILAGDRGKAAAGTLVFVTHDSFDMSNSFKNYLENITSSSQTKNPWLKQFWEVVLECDYPGSFNKRYSKTCGKGIKFSTVQVENFAKSQRSVHVHQATFALEKAYRQVMNDVSCQSFRNRDCADKFVTAIKSTELVGSNGERLRVFKDDGNGYMGFTVYNIQAVGQNNYEYVNVGSYSSTNSEKLKLNISRIKTYKEGNPPILVNDLQATCEAARSLRAPCLAICPITSTLPPTTTAPITPKPEEPTSDNSTLLNIILAVVIGVLLLVLIFLAVMMCRQQKVTHAFQNKEMIMKSPSVGSLNIYEEPYRERRKRTTSFEQNEHVNSSTSGVISMRSGRAGSLNVSNGTTQSVKTPIKYSELLQLEVPSTDTTKCGSRASVATYLDPANNDIPKIQITQDDSMLRNPKYNVNEQQQRSLSSNNLKDSDSQLNYIQAKDLEIEDEEELAQQELDLNYRQRAISLNDSMINGQNNVPSQRPATLPGIMPRSVPGNSDQMRTPSYPAPVLSSHISPMYLDAIHDTQINEQSMYPGIPIQFQGNPSNTQLLMVSPGTYVPAMGYPGNPASGYQHMYIPTAPHSNIGYQIPATTFANQDLRRPRASSLSAGVQHSSLSPQIAFLNINQRSDMPQSVHSVALRNNREGEFVSSTLPAYKNKSKDQREHYHSMTSMPDVISHEHDDGTEIMI